VKCIAPKMNRSKSTGIMCGGGGFQGAVRVTHTSIPVLGAANGCVPRQKYVPVAKRTTIGSTEIFNNEEASV